VRRLDGDSLVSSTSIFLSAPSVGIASATACSGSPVCPCTLTIVVRAPFRPLSSRLKTISCTTSKSFVLLVCGLKSFLRNHVSCCFSLLIAATLSIKITNSVLIGASLTACAIAASSASSDVWRVQSFFASQTLHNKKNLKKNPAM